MAEGAALLVDHVLPAVDYRQWVLSFTGPMAVRLGYDQALLAGGRRCIGAAVMHDMRWAVKERHDLGSVEPLHAGTCARELLAATERDRRRWRVQPLAAISIAFLRTKA